MSKGADQTDLRPKVRLVVTGHRPQDLGGYGQESFLLLVDFAARYLQRAKYRIDTVICGMAQGWDMAIAQACLQVGIPFRAFVPFLGQESQWNASTQRQYQQPLSSAADVVVVSEGGFAPWKMQVRNQAMVDQGDVLLALFSGRPGGTANAVAYAGKRGVMIVNLWGDWTAFSAKI